MRYNFDGSLVGVEIKDFSFANTIEIAIWFPRINCRDQLLAAIELDHMSDDNLYKPTDRRDGSFHVMWYTSNYVKLQPQRNLHQPRLGRPRASRIYTWATFEHAWQPALGKSWFFVDEKLLALHFRMSLHSKNIPPGIHVYIVHITEISLCFDKISIPIYELIASDIIVLLFLGIFYCTVTVKNYSAN